MYPAVRYPRDRDTITVSRVGEGERKTPVLRLHRRAIQINAHGRTEASWRWPDLEKLKTPVTRLHSNEAPVSRWWKRFVQEEGRWVGEKEWLTRIQRGRRIFSLPHDPRRPTTGRRKNRGPNLGTRFIRIVSECWLVTIFPTIVRFDEKFERELNNFSKILDWNFDNWSDRKKA